MSRASYIASFVLGVAACDGHRDIRLLAPETQLQGGAGEPSGGRGGAAALQSGGSAGANGSAVSLPNPTIVFKNLLILMPSAQIGSDSWQLTSEQTANISIAFRVTFPALVADFTAGKVVFDNYVTVLEEPLTSVGYYNDMVDTQNVPGGESLAGPAGTYDCVYVITARPQGSAYARGDLTPDLNLCWVSVGPHTDLAKNGYAMSAWLFGWLAEMGPRFYSNRLGLDQVPGINSSDQYGYARNQDGLNDFLAWYRDYLTRSIVYNNANWGLGDAAWKLGTLRDWAKVQ